MHVACKAHGHQTCVDDVRRKCHWCSVLTWRSVYACCTGFERAPVHWRLQPGTADPADRAHKCGCQV
eukprot:347467-Chlamydomonas_euryale.AAC.1